MGKAIAAEMTPGVPGADVSSLEAKPCQRPQPPARVGTRCLRHWAGGLPTLFSLKRQQPQDCVFNCNTHISSPGRGCGVWGRKEARMPTFQAKGTRPPAGPSLPFASESSAFGWAIGQRKVYRSLRHFLLVTKHFSTEKSSAHRVSGGKQAGNPSGQSGLLPETAPFPSCWGAAGGLAS